MVLLVATGQFALATVLVLLVGVADGRHQEAERQNDGQ
jgi:hypothetical protein